MRFNKTAAQTSGQSCSGAATVASAAPVLGLRQVSLILSACRLRERNAAFEQARQQEVGAGRVRSGRRARLNSPGRGQGSLRYV